MLLEFDLPFIDTGIDTPPEAAIVVIAFFYIVAALFNSPSPTPASTIARRARTRSS